MNNQRISETTPLLPVQYSSDDVYAAPITPVVRSLDTADLAHLRWEDLTPSPLPASLELDHCKRLAFALIVLFQLRRQKITSNGKNLDVYEQWTDEEARTRDVETLEEKVNELWENFLAQYHGPQELYDVLWSQFPLLLGRSPTIRVIDFLTSHDAPQKFVVHPIVSMTVAQTWGFGRPESNILPTWLSNSFNTDATPYKTHLLELFFDLGSTLLLLSYVIRPPNWPDSDNRSQDPITNYSYTPRELYLVVYALSVLVSAQGAIVITSALILLAFALSCPSLPLPGGLPFSVLLWVAPLRFFMYHKPSILPGPLLLIAHHHSLPLAKFFANGLARIIRPLFFFYLPVALIACFTLSISLSGPLIGPLTYLHAFHLSQWIPPTPGSDLPIIGVAPMDTRILFFLFSVAVLLFVIASAYVIGTSTPVAYVRPTIQFPSLAWDFYTPEIGYEARIESYRATMVYSMDYPFPPPLNLIELLFVTIPISFVRALGYRHAKRATIARFIWNLTVRPFMIIMIPFYVFLTLLLRD
ncbi:hypothetical protein P691DRAFT_678948 [Macrolepiota fuliginosa MF-IS2]|uniref:Uncharacterized protein n=1 Tax=Macrolepiota fuliginosa MF-IS2 TaxID=1400762 RepID=A0A9P5X451_9AGAR|nr:hypothetical protein P691DRAFT_678948 [Macrolepiota fuliginosa MF-IS2]